MLNRLEAKYAHAIAKDQNSIPSSFRFTIADTIGEVLTFDKRLLTKEEKNLLETLFDVVDNTLLKSQPGLEEDLYTWLIDKEERELSLIKNSITLPCRFIHFYIKGTLSDQSDFVEAMKNLFSSSTAFLWITPFKGVLIQSIDEDFDDILTENSIIDTIASDFFVQLTLYVGSSITTFEKMKQQFEWENSIFDSVKQMIPSKNIFVEQEVIPFFIMNDISDLTKQTLLKMLAPVLDDQTLLDSVKIYLECNMNASLAAKKMYMHRNTLQYRVEKFIEKTSIDIKRFPNAVAVYFMFTMLHYYKEE